MSLAMVFAVSTALLLGGSDFFAARSARSTPSITVTRTAVSASQKVFFRRCFSEDIEFYYEAFVLYFVFNSVFILFF